MKLKFSISGTEKRQSGWALLVVMTLAACALMVLASVMSWANENATVTSRNNEYFSTCYAAESATEKVLAAMFQQYQDFGMAYIDSNMTTYASTIPTASDGACWSSYQFSGGTTLNHIIVNNTSNNQQIVLGGTSSGLNLMENTYEIIANAKNTNSGNNIVGTVGQQIYLGTIPLFQFAIFYQGSLEMAPGAAMTVTGPVHGNTNIYLDPQTGLTFSATVGAVGNVYTNQSPLDPSVRTFSWVDYNGSPSMKDNTIPLNLPVGTNATGTVSNSSQNVYAILEPPTPGETPNTLIGSNLLYNKADMIVIVSNNNTISVTSGAYVNNQATVISNTEWQNFLSTNGTFMDQRDGSNVNQVVIDVGKLVNWSATNSDLSAALNAVRPGEGNVQSIYVDDQRSTSNAVVTAATNVNTGKVSYSTNIVMTQPGVVLTNGAALPPQGLSIATPDPAYIVGDWNIKMTTNSGAPSDVSTSTTTYSLPSAIYADAITILSPSWNPANSALPIANRTASSDTVNAAFLTGNVPSDGAYYSGGVENFPRFLENWNGQTFYYNGSMVCMFESKIADAPWPGTGSVYNPPARDWAFDTNFTNPSKQPPMTPQIISVQRSKWALLPPYSTSF